MTLGTRAAAAAKLVELLLFPSYCRLCGDLLDESGERIVCRACLGRLAPRRGPVCPCCGRFLEGSAEGHYCRRCLERPPAFTLHRSCGAYDGALKDIIRLLKYRRFAVLGRPLAAFAETCLAPEEGLWQEAAALVPVPLHRSRERERGFNQSRAIAAGLGRSRGLPLLDRCLVKVRNAPPQASLEAGDREKNVRDAYAVKGPRRISGQTIILVDDVFTTGATLRECSRVLVEAGAREVRALTIAQA
ncbi:MAG: ComF family protein [Candidatus Aminicenantes bacterium]|nr:ComF family protein [Candidatus Aminicenantes bacterium]